MLFLFSFFFNILFFFSPPLSELLHRAQTQTPAARPKPPPEQELGLEGQTASSPPCPVPLSPFCSLGTGWCRQLECWVLHSAPGPAEGQGAGRAGVLGSSMGVQERLSPAAVFLQRSRVFVSRPAIRTVALSSHALVKRSKTFKTILSAELCAESCAGFA